METRDQWYKPNLLYNIHYRPPKKPEPPRMIVETVQFNPSICTCGEHGCQPQYRMEKRILWTNKEEYNKMQQKTVNDRESKNEYRESKFEERITKKDGTIGNVIESKQMELNEENVEECRFLTDGDGNKYCSAESFKERMSGDVEVKSGYKVNYVVKDKGNTEVESDDDDNEGREEANKEECVGKNEVWYSNSKDEICIEKEASNTNDSKDNNSNGRSNSDDSDCRDSERIYGEKSTGNAIEHAFSDDRKRDGNSFKEDKIDKDQTTAEGHGAVDSDCASDDEVYCIENRILIPSSDETAESCSLESKDEDLKDVQIASDFGIMSIYCNSELHSWTSFKGENA